MFTKSVLDRLPPGWTLRLAQGMDREAMRNIDPERIYFSIPDIHGRAVIARAIIELLERLGASRVVFLAITSIAILAREKWWI